MQTRQKFLHKIFERRIKIRIKYLLKNDRYKSIRARTASESPRIAKLQEQKNNTVGNIK